MHTSITPFPGLRLAMYTVANTLVLTRIGNGGALVVLDGTAAGASGLEGLDDVQGLLVSDLAKNDVAAVQPGGDDGSDEELGAVAALCVSQTLKKVARLPLTCWGRRWPWTADQAFRASA